jgi:hypothetical protein
LGVQLGDIVDVGDIQQMTTQLKIVSTLFQYSRHVDLICNFHDFIKKIKKISSNIVTSVV